MKQREAERHTVMSQTKYLSTSCLLHKLPERKPETVETLITSNPRETVLTFCSFFSSVCKEIRTTRGTTC